MGLIYVNPEGPNGVPDPMASARDIRETFARMAMDDEETVALVAGGHTFGKTHGAASANDHVGAEPEGAPIEEQGLGWKNSFGTGIGVDTITSGLEGAWTTNPIAWDDNCFENLLGYDWVQTRSPAGAIQWIPADPAAHDTVPDAHDPSRRHAPIMSTADMALKVDPVYAEISRRFFEHPDQFADAFARAWFKLTHRDMGPIARYLGPLVPDETLIWQDPVPPVTHPLVDDADIDSLKATILDSGLTGAQLVSTAWASASTFRTTDKRGGANGARIRLSPQAEWDVNVTSGVARVVSVLDGVRQEFDAAQTDGTKVSLADLIVLGGGVAIEQAARLAGHDVTVPFTPGRTDATQEQTDVDSFAVLEPTADGFRNHLQKGRSLPTEHLLIEKAFMLTLSAPEMAVLVGGLRVLDANVGQSTHGVLTDRPGVLTNDFFVNLLDMATEWSPASAEDAFVGRDRATGETRWTATSVDLVFGSNSQLRAIAEVYGSADAQQQFVGDFVAAWSKVMELDRFELDH
jgi:catalase-peroxidase